MRLLTCLRRLVPPLALVCSPLLAQAQETLIPGDSYHWQLQARGLYFRPQNQHLPLDFDLKAAALGELAGEWFFIPDWSTELAVQSPADLDVTRNRGTVRLLTQTLTVKYYIRSAAVNDVVPYVGTGIYHSTASRSGTAPTVNVDDPGFGWVLQAGFTYGVTPDFFVSADVRYLDNFEPDLLVGGTGSGRIGINPIVLGFGVGLRF